MERLAWVVLLWAAVGLVSTGARAQDAAKDPDRLYADREHVQSAIEAAAVWDARLKKDPKDFEAAWKLARACYWLGGHVAADEQRAQYRARHRGRTTGLGDARRSRRRPLLDGGQHGRDGRVVRPARGIKYRSPVKKALETVLMIDRGFQQGSADRALGRWYLKVPRLFGGSKDKSVEHLKQSLTYDPTSLASHYFLAETYLEMDRKDEARQEAQKVLDLPDPPRLGARRSRVQAESQGPPRTPALSRYSSRIHEVTT